MEILGIGAPELIFVILIALIVLGPKDMQKAGRTIGQWLNQLVRSDSWQVFQKTSREIRNLPTQLMRDANYEMMKADEAVRNTIAPPAGVSAGHRTRSAPRTSRPSLPAPTPNDPEDEREPDA
jgi:sec-independent protein translocase protein TatB